MNLIKYYIHTYSTHRPFVLTTCTIQTILSGCITATWIFSRALESTGQAQAIHPCTFRSHSIPLANSGHTPLAEEQRQKRQRAEEGFSCTCIDLTCCNTLPTVSSASQRSNCMTRKVCTMSGEYHAFSVYKYSNSFVFTVCVVRIRGLLKACGYEGGDRRKNSLKVCRHVRLLVYLRV